MASESGGRDNQLPQALMGTQYLGLLSFMAVYLSVIPCTRLFSPFLSFFLSAGPMAFQLSPSLRADKSWPTVPRCVCMGIFFPVHMVHRGPFFCAHCETFNRQSYTLCPHQPGIIFELELGTEKKKKCHRRIRIRI